VANKGCNGVLQNSLRAVNLACGCVRIPGYPLTQTANYLSRLLDVASGAQEFAALTRAGRVSPLWLNALKGTGPLRQ
jgi:hypothetical protein